MLTHLWYGCVVTCLTQCITIPHHTIRALNVRLQFKLDAFSDSSLLLCRLISLYLSHFLRLFAFYFFLLEIGNAAKAKICLNLVKNFCGDGVQYKDIESQVNQIESNALTVKVEGTFAFVELNLNLNSFFIPFDFLFSAEINLKMCSWNLHYTLQYHNWVTANMTHWRMQRKKLKFEKRRSVEILLLQTKRWTQVKRLLSKSRLPHVCYPNILERIVCIACDGKSLLKIYK